MKRDNFIIVIVLISIHSIFAADIAIGDKASIDGNFTTIWGANMDNSSSGFSENIDINFNWDVNEWGDYSSSIEEVDFNAPYGMAFVSGGLIRFKLNDLTIDNNEGDDLLDVQIVLENAWAKIIVDKFYIQLATDGTFYNREAGYNFNYSKDQLRSNWAHIGSRIQQSYILDDDDYNVDDDMDTVTNDGSTAGVFVGTDLEKYKTYIAVGSPSDMDDNTNNEYDFCWGNEITPVENFVISTGIYTSINSDDTSLGFGTQIAYGQKISKRLTLEPFIAYDGQFQNDELTSLASEIAYGLTLTWPGSNGWGYEWLYDEDRGMDYGFEANYSKRYSGFTVSGNMTIDEDEVEHNLQVSMYEETIEGLIPGIGSSLLFEVKDMTDEIQYAYGIYTEYNYFNIFNIFARAENKDSLASTIEIYGGAGLSWLALPNTILTLRYDNEQINDFNNNKGSVMLIANLTL